ncbi:response regulator transcription factor [Microcella frigidaquae]|uniref:DNA-binding response OmpR family regulator n=1 Tax=Microcella frigidaquae TaxID=424758 RepID=A0A840X784_9MICO|nr:response regulator transcription factor [Microcella frigidaquae]MBB5617064.1 DNA-binding response OmpR family regulator [Microcella frigidaquae]MCA1943623.1 response regulator transcription factor [Microcella sp.]NHN45269.1 response regulator transcription factor [Microcella frigidaquae]
MTSILIVEDEARISSFIEKGLAAAGYTPTVVGNGLDALDYVATGSFDLVLLDVGLPGIDGFEVLARLRAAGETMPIIMLTARTSTDDTVAGLDGGANDYLPKPFKFDELVARIRLRLRESGQQTVAETVLRHGEVALDLRTRRVTVGERTIDLSAREFALAEQFLRHPDQVLSREQLLSRVWGFDFDPGSNVVDVYVRYLRGKIGADRIETVRGMGYRLV